jgi:hypothetical protein
MPVMVEVIFWLAEHEYFDYCVVMAVQTPFLSQNSALLCEQCEF